MKLYVRMYEREADQLMASLPFQMEKFASMQSKEPLSDYRAEWGKYA